MDSNNGHNDTDSEEEQTASVAARDELFTETHEKKLPDEISPLDEIEHNVLEAMAPHIDMNCGDSVSWVWLYIF